VVGSATEISDGNPDNSDGDHTAGSSGAFVGYDDDYDLSNGNDNQSATGDLNDVNGVDPDVATIFWPLDEIQASVNGDGPDAAGDDQDTVQFSYRVRIN
jgi:hypothetical protein